MRDIDIITKAMEDAQVLLHVSSRPGRITLRAWCSECLRYWTQSMLSRLRTGCVRDMARCGW
jgi:hypothetical protein